MPAEGSSESIHADVPDWSRVERKRLTEEQAADDGDAERPAQVEVDISPRDVVIKAQTSHWHDDRDAHVYQCEFKPGQIFRLVHLPQPVDATRAQAELENGVLHVTAPIAHNDETAEQQKK
jgi:HSP20 family molecular chaperone IbpA